MSPPVSASSSRSPSPVSSPSSNPVQVLQDHHATEGTSKVGAAVIGQGSPLLPSNAIEMPGAAIASFFEDSLLEASQKTLMQTSTSELASSAPYAYNLLKNNFQHVGLILSPDNHCLGTATLITNNTLLLPRHVIEGHDVCKFTVQMGVVEAEEGLSNSGTSSLKYIIEESMEYDYALVVINESLGDSLGFASLSKDAPLVESALLHYPLGNPLRVSINTLDTVSNENIRQLSNHDTNHSSSGGAYFGPNGKMNAMHLGSEWLLNDIMALQKYALPLSFIANNSRDSILGKLINGEFAQDSLYFSDSPIYKLQSEFHGYILDEEGAASKKLIDQVFSKELKEDSKIQEILSSNSPTKAKVLNDYLKLTYKVRFEDIENACIGKTGKHKETQKYSIHGYVDSDHTLPYDVWNNTTNPLMKDMIKGRGNRPGELDLPAVTIPHAFHKKLLTTGTGVDQTTFRALLASLCDTEISDGVYKTYQAVHACFRHYAKIDNSIYERLPIHAAINEYFKVGVITKDQKQEIIDNLDKGDAYYILD